MLGETRDNRVKIMEIGATLAKARKERGLTQRQVGNIVGCSHTTVSKWENGETEPSIADLQRLASYYGVDFAALLGGPADEGGPSPLNAAPASPDTDNGVVRMDAPAGPITDPTVARLIGLLESLEKDVARALSIADKNSDAVSQMSADTHRLIERFVGGTAASPPADPGAGPDQEGSGPT